MLKGYINNIYMLSQMEHIKKVTQARTRLKNLSLHLMIYSTVLKKMILTQKFLRFQLQLIILFQMAHIDLQVQFFLKKM